MAFKNITSAEFIKYNANAAGHSSPDCVKRALSLAFNMPYNEIAKELIAMMKQLRRDHWNVPSVYEHIIRRHGGGDKVVTYDPMQLHEFADTVGKEGTWLVTTGHKTGKPNHIVCVLDGTVYDSWDSTTQYVCSWYPVSGDFQRNFTEIDVKDYIPEIEETAKAVGNSLVAKYPWGQYVTKVDMTTRLTKDNKYKAHCFVHMTVGDRPYYSGNTRYNFDFHVVFTLSTTDEEAHKIIKNTVKTRMYDRFYSINQQEKKLEERAQYGTVIKPEWMSPQEERFWNTLSAKAQSIVTYVSIQQPNQYHDSCQVKVIPQHGEDERRIWLEAYNTGELRELIDAYIKDGTTWLEF